MNKMREQIDLGRFVGQTLGDSYIKKDTLNFPSIKEGPYLFQGESYHTLAGLRAAKDQWLDVNCPKMLPKL
tara:strand:+ start:633 stop:845 length:213 start_codon:yes stop_codon:yes gene_type:complete